MTKTAAGTRTCTVCGSSDWGTRNRCKPCRARDAREAWARDPEASRAKDRVRTRAWRAANPEVARAATRRQRYALTPDAFEQMLVAQGRRCCICGAAEPTCVDHCHATKRVRGILCRKCNAGLGQFDDEPARLRAAAAYIERSKPPK
jgi:hypothetical protein